MSQLDLLAKLKLVTSDSNRTAPATPTSSQVKSEYLFYGDVEDKSYIHSLKGMFGEHSPYLKFGGIVHLPHLSEVCRSSGVRRVVTTSPELLNELVRNLGAELGSKKPRIDDYQGSIFDHGELEILFISPLRQLQTVKYGSFIARRFISKFVEQTKWREPTEFRWTVGEPDNIPTFFERFSSAFAVSIDIETFKENLSIRCVGFTGIFLGEDGITTQTIVISFNSEFNYTWIKKFCEELEAPKIFQNGKYDNSYLLRYDIKVYNWLWDTASMMHAWYSELPKDLGFLNSFFLRKVVYWKDLSETNDLYEYYRYNAMDTWATANVFIEWILSAPDWARRNYQIKFILNFPCLLAELTGIERDMERSASLRREKVDQENVKLSLLRRCIGVPTFNPGSPKQVVGLLAVLGCNDITSSGDKELAKAKLRHPLNNFLLKLITEIRELRKAIKTYLRTDEDRKNPEDEDQKGAKEFHGRILYALNPDGTDTARLASREHHFWCGLQIQNITVDGGIKSTFKSSSDFKLGECDLEQAESRDTGYISGETNLIAAVESPRDFHSINCSAFFGIPYDDIYDDSIRKPKNKKLRDLSKRVNHGFNYNMGADVLIDTMGLDKIWFAGKELKLLTTDPREIAEHLLACADKTYPGLKGSGGYYDSVKREVELTHKLTSRAFHHTDFNLTNYEPIKYIETGDWVRYCFGNPSKSKLDLNALVAHCPQSLNARTLNEAWRVVFYEIALPNPLDFRLHAQIHDSILFSYRNGREDLAHKVRSIMEIPVTIRDIHGTYRKFTVPAALKIGKKDVNGKLKPAVYWDETE